MELILTDITPEKLKEAIHENYVSFINYIPNSLIDVNEKNGIMYTSSPIIHLFLIEFLRHLNWKVSFLNV